MLDEATLLLAKPQIVQAVDSFLPANLHLFLRHAHVKVQEEFDEAKLHATLDALLGYTNHRIGELAHLPDYELSVRARLGNTLRRLEIAEPL